jgi:hypothetical protein
MTFLMMAGRMEREVTRYTPSAAADDTTEREASQATR